MMRGARGAVAQLGERLPCTEEVRGSSPLSSTFCPSTSVPLRLRKSRFCSWDTTEPFPIAPCSSPVIPTRVWQYMWEHFGRKGQP